MIESWRRHYNTLRPHGSLGYKPPAPEVFVPAMSARAAQHPQLAPPRGLTLMIERLEEFAARVRDGLDDLD